MRVEALFKAGTEIVTHLARRVITAPFRLAIHRHPCQWVIIGRDDGRFVDNAKHFFCWLHTHAPTGYTFTFVSEDSDTVEQLRSHGARAVLFPRDEATAALLRAGTVVIDNYHPFQRGHLDWFRGTRIVQLWHGAPIKEIEQLPYRRRLKRLGSIKGILAKIHAALTDAYPRLDILVSPSTFYTRHVFDICFNTKNIVEAGYSRNDCLLSPELEVDGLLSMNVDQKARHRMVEHRRRGGRVVLYAPTYRDDFRSPLDDGSIDLPKWAEAAGRNNMLLVMKLHPEMLGRTRSITDNAIVHIEPSSDIYPLLREVDLLVSDYSSIHFDFLLLDRPIVFFPYDLSRYISENRPLMFDYDSMTPGPKAHNFTELLSLIQTELGEGKTDPWKKERDRVRNLAFDHIDCHASERIWMKLSGKDSCTA